MAARKLLRRATSDILVIAGGVMALHYKNLDKVVRGLYNCCLFGSFRDWEDHSNQGCPVLDRLEIIGADTKSYKATT